MKERYHITGMTCSACSSHVEKSCNKLNGVEQASVNLLTETMDITYDPEKLTQEDIVDAVVKAGYGASLLEENGKPAASSGKETTGRGSDSLHAKAQKEEKAMRWRLGISIAFLIPLMYVAMHHMYHEWFGIPVPAFITRTMHGNANAMNFALTQFLLLLPILYMNRKFFSVGFKTLFHLSPNMDSLIALGATAATGYGIFAMYRISYGLGYGDMAVVEHYSHDLYFESAGMILTLITVGKYLEGRSKGKTSDAITKLMDLSPKTAVVLTENGEEKEIPTNEVRTGDIFLVKPGSSVPVDGTVVEGNSSIDESAITGESIPVEKQAGDHVVSATINKAGFLKCRADRVGDDTTLAQIIHLVEEASASKAPIAKLADRVAGVFVPVVIGIALVTLLGWLLSSATPEFAISSAIAVLVISCPCALGLATPVAIMVGTGVGANHGILIKSGEALQQAKEVNTVVLDKTGTVTSGKLHVEQILIAGGNTPDPKGTSDSMSKSRLVEIAAALEKKSEHPLAEAIVDYAVGEKLSIPEVADFRATFGRGVEGNLQDKKYYLGNLAFLEEHGIAVSETEKEQINHMAEAGMTPLHLAEEHRFLGVIGVADEIKASSFRAIKAWEKMGIRVIMLTGDNRRTAEAVRQKLGIAEVVAEVRPQDKEQKIRQLQEQGCKVAMVGDGINDAPALAAADVGMAIGAGTDVAIESADIVLMKSDLRDAVTAMKLSRSVIGNIKQNLFWAFFYNSIGIPLAAGLLYPAFQIRLTPMFGAAAMSLSSIFVVGNALRLRGFRSGFEKEQDSGSNQISAAQETVKSETVESESVKTESERKQNNMTKVITIEGMMCAHCTGRVQKALEAVEGVSEVTVSLENKNATVVANDQVSEDTLKAAVTEAGYEVTDIQ